MKKTHAFSACLLKAAACLFFVAGATFSMSAANESMDAAPAVAQQGKVTVKGIVKDEAGYPVIGASVFEKGVATNGTITDMDGAYSITVGNNATLVISSIGYVTVEVAASNAAEVVLREDAELLNDVVVIGYGTQRKGDVTSAITSVKADDFIKGDIKDAGDLIKGKVAGLSITNNSGDPNSTSSIRLRGVISLTGTNTPLVLIDGLEGALDTVAPEDIESIDVLKDASAAAIYGTRGAAGVIIITTKAGKREEAVRVNYAGYVSASAFGKTLDMMTAEDIREGKTNFKDLGHETDWLKEISRTALTHNHNVSISGGSKNTSYNADFTYRNQQGVIKNTYGNEMRFNAAVSHWFFNDMLKLSFNIQKRWHDSGPVDAANTQVYRQAIIRNPTAPIKNEDGSWHEDFTLNYYQNPLAILYETEGGRKSENTRLTGNITFEPIQGWQTNLMLSTNRSNGSTETYTTSKAYGQILNGTTGYAYIGHNYSKTDNLELTSTYKHSWGDHRLEGVVGYSYQYSYYDNSSMSNTNYMSDYFQWHNIGLGEYLKLGRASMSSYAEDSKLIGFIGRVSYGYGNRYNALVSVRREGSSRFGENHHWGTFPSVSLGWTISNEKFMQGATWLDNLKLRAGFGVTGVIPTQSYLSKTIWQLGGSYFYDGGTWKQGLNIASNPNPDLQWEKSAEWNIGLDWSVLDNRLGGTIDVYNKQTSGMLWEFTVPVPPNLFNKTLANVGKMENKGVEIAINAVPVQRGGFTWKTTATFAFNANKLVSLSNDLYETANTQYVAYLGEPISLPTQRMEVGQPLGQWFGLKAVGVSDKGLWLIEHPETKEVTELTDGMLTDRTWHQYLGNAIPKMNFGWNHTFTYKGFDLNLQFTGQFGAKILNEARAYYENNAVAFNKLKSATEKPFGQNVLSVAQKQTFTSYHLENGGYLKLANVTFGYNVPVKENKFIKGARVYASAANLFVITKYSGLDPELSNSSPTYSGIDSRDKYPSIRTFTAGVNLNF
ncbi:MAG: TonB-dependent receptor [Bacteroidales bacterium]|nr:TonB-dependent receptor [Candidatus Cryptobacteroides caccocaballi]